MKQRLFLVRNYDRKEAHFELTDINVGERVRELRETPDEILAHWQWDVDDIECDSLRKTGAVAWGRLQLFMLKRQFKRHCSGWKVL